MKDTSALKTDSLINVDEIVDRYINSFNKDKNDKSKIKTYDDQLISKSLDSSNSIYSSNESYKKNSTSNAFGLNLSNDLILNENRIDDKNDGFCISLTDRLEFNNEAKKYNNDSLFSEDLIKKTDDLDEMLSKLETSLSNNKNNLENGNKKSASLELDLNHESATNRLNDFKSKIELFEAKTRKLSTDKTINQCNKTNFLNEKNNLYDDIICDSFKQKFTSQLIRFNESNDVNNILEKPSEIKQSNYTKYFFNDDENELTKPINNDKIVYFNTSNKRFGEKKTKSFRFFKKNDKGNVVKEHKIEKKINKQKRKAIWKSIPSFYRFENFIAIFFLLISIFVFIGSLSSLIYVLIQIFNFGESQWLLLPQTIFNVLGLFFITYGIFNLSNIRKELKINNYIIGTESITPFIKRKYKSLCSSYIILNWSALSVYVVGCLLILMLYIVGYFHNLINSGINEFGYLTINGNDNVLNIILWSVVSTIIFFVLWQIVSFLVNKKRKSEIELFYQKDIISDEMIQKYKKSANKKGLLIFIISTLVVSISILIVWLIFRKISISKSLKNKVLI